MAESKEIFPDTSKFKSAILLMNRLDAGKLGRLLTSIIKGLDKKTEPLFSDDEKEQLVAMFEITPLELTVILESAAFIFEQAAYFSLKIPVFKEHLENAGLEQDQNIAFLKTWDAEGRSFINKLRDRCISPYVLGDVKYQLHLEMAQSKMSRLRDPTALFELTLQPTTQLSQEKKVRMEMNHEQLYEFYQQLEVIQKQIDELS